MKTNAFLWSWGLSLTLFLAPCGFASNRAQWSCCCPSLFGAGQLTGAIEVIGRCKDPAKSECSVRIN
jgi:hypothetical protein